MEYKAGDVWTRMTEFGNGRIVIEKELNKQSVLLITGQTIDKHSLNQKYRKLSTYKYNQLGDKNNGIL